MDSAVLGLAASGCGCRYGAGFTMDSVVLGLAASGCGCRYGAGFTADFLHSRMPLSFTPLLCLKLCHASDQWHSSWVFTPLTG